MQTRNITLETEQYYVEALVHYTVDQEGDGIDSPVMTEVEIDEVVIDYLERYNEETDSYYPYDPTDEETQEIELLIETKFRKLYETRTKSKAF